MAGRLITDRGPAAWSRHRPGHPVVRNRAARRGSDPCSPPCPDTDSPRRTSRWRASRPTTDPEGGSASARRAPRPPSGQWTRRRGFRATARTVLPVEQHEARAERRPKGGALGLFSKRCRALKGKAGPRGGTLRLFCKAGTLSRPARRRALGGILGLFCKRSRVLKGIPSLCKCYNACKVW